MIITYELDHAVFLNTNYIVFRPIDKIGMIYCIFLYNLNFYTFLEQIGHLIEEYILEPLKCL